MFSKPQGSVRAQKVISIAEQLVREGRLSSAQLAVALESTKNLGKSLDDILIGRGFLSEQEFNEKLAAAAGVKMISLATMKPSLEVIKLISALQATRWQIVPVSEDATKLMVATADPFNLGALEEAKRELGRDIECMLTSPKEIEQALKTYYDGEHAGRESAIVSIAQVEGFKSAANEVARQKIKSQPAKAPTGSQEQEFEGQKTTAIVDELLDKAYLERASDIHVDPTRDGLTVRVRIDGILEQVRVLPMSMQQPILSRIKIMGSMDVAEHRTPQDGRARLHIRGKELDVRISTFPTIHGEAAAIRLLSKENLLTLEDMGFLGNDREIFERLILQPNGMLLVTGPTGSGKTTTLYAALQRIDRTKNRVLTVEDPVENEIDGVNQTQINVKAGVTFPVVVRSMLREDPDVILIGEIRDQETAEMSVRAAMTGHLVLSTLHTNTAIGSIARLVDLGLEPYLISSTLIGVMAQRLVRRICPSCKEAAPIPPEQLKRFGFRGAGLHAFIGRGCNACSMRGYKGRIGLFELVAVDDEFRVLINTRAPEVRLKEKAASLGSHSLLEDGINKIKQGITSVEEVLKVCGDL